MRGGTGIRRVQVAEPLNVASQFDDALVVDVVQHRLAKYLVTSGELVM
jgi:hypothetical protein